MYAPGWRRLTAIGKIGWLEASSATPEICLGSGGFADIYLAEHSHLNKLAAIKILRAGLVSDENIKQFRKEARTIASLDHPHMQAHKEMVQYCLQAGQREEATQYQSVIARYYFERHDTNNAVAALQQHIAMDRSNFEAYDLPGQIYSEVGEYEQAMRVYRNLAKVDPNNAIAYERIRRLQELRARQV